MKEHSILLVDDDPDDLLLLHEAFRHVGSDLTILEARDGIEAMRQLENLYTSSTLPSLVILDINMPRLNGKETLEAIKANERLNAIPIVMFSTSSNENDKTFFLQRKVEFITKPLDVESLFSIATKLLTYCSR